MKIIIKYDELYGLCFDSKTIATSKTISFKKIDQLFAKFKIGEKYFIIKKDSENNENNHEDANGNKDSKNSDILEIFEVSKLYKLNMSIDLHLEQLNSQSFNEDLNKNDNNGKDLKIEKATQIKLENISINNISIISFDNSNKSLIIDYKIFKEKKNSILINTNRQFIEKVLDINGKIKKNTGKFEYQGDSIIFLSNIVNNNQQKELVISKDETTKIIFNEINLTKIDEAAQIADALDEILK